MKKIVFIAIALSMCRIHAQDLVFGVDPVLLKGGQIELAAIGLYVKDKEREKTLIAAPRFKWGITSNWEFNLTVPLVNQKRTLSLANVDCQFPVCDRCANELVIKGVGDIFARIKYQPYRYVDKDAGEARLFTLLAGVAIPGNLPESGAGPIVIEDELITTGTDVGCPKTSLVIGASTLLVGAPWGILASLLIGIERENECGNRSGHFFSYSYGVGRKFGDHKFMDIFGLLEFDWIYESSAVQKGKKVPCTSNHIFWFGPNLIINQATREFKFGIQAPLAKININRDYRLFLAFEWEY